MSLCKWCIFNLHTCFDTSKECEECDGYSNYDRGIDNALIGLADLTLIDNFKIFEEKVIKVIKAVDHIKMTIKITKDGVKVE